MTATIAIQQRSSLWDKYLNWVTSTDNRLYVGHFGVLMIPTLVGGYNRIHRCIHCSTTS